MKWPFAFEAWKDLIIACTLLLLLIMLEKRRSDRKQRSVCATLVTVKGGERNVSRRDRCAKKNVDENALNRDSNSGNILDIKRADLLASLSETEPSQE